MGAIDTYIKQNEKKRFWPWARCTHSFTRFDPGTAKYRQKFDLMFGRGKLRRVRHYKGPDGERLITVEIEVS